MPLSAFWRGALATAVLSVATPAGAATLSGAIWSDADADRIRDTTESALAGRYVVLATYVDSNGNGSWQSGEPATCVAQAMTASVANASVNAFAITGVNAGRHLAIEAGAGGLAGLTAVANYSGGIACTPQTLASDPGAFSSTTPNILDVAVSATGTLTTSQSSAWGAAGTTLSSASFGDRASFTSAAQSCPAEAFQSLGSSTWNLTRFNLSSAVQTTIKTNYAPAEPNGLGWSQTSRALWGVRSLSGAIFTVNPGDGTYVELGVPYNLDHSNYLTAGDIRPDGADPGYRLYLAGAGKLQVVDLNANSPSYLTVIASATQPSGVTSDMAFSAGGALWSTNGTSLTRIDPDTLGLLQTVPVTYFTGTGLVGFPGAQYFDSAGRFYALDNPNGRIFQYDTATGAAALFSQTSASNFNNDGAGCPALIVNAYDRSDAPIIGYGEALHQFRAGYLLGTGIDVDLATIANANASGDGGDDDGVTLPTLRQAEAASMHVVARGAGAYLQAFVDWNGDGDFADAGEQIATDLQDGGPLDTSSSAAIIEFAVTPPASAIITAPTFARFRWSTAAGLSATAIAPDGEVEDYQLTILFGIDAVADDFTGSPFLAGSGGTTASVFANDVLSGAAVAPAQVIPSLVSNGGLTGAAIAADGTIAVPAATPAGTYTLTYRICAVAAPALCDTANATIRVIPPPTIAIAKAADAISLAGNVPAGHVVTYHYTVTNTSVVALTAVAIADAHNGIGTPPLPGGETLTQDVAPTGDSTDAAQNGSWDTLGPGDTVTFTASYTVTQGDVDQRQ